MQRFSELSRLLLFLPLLLVPACGNGAEVDGAADGIDAASPAGEQATQTPPQEQDAQQPVDLAGVGFDEGDPEEAVVRVIEFSDFGCVHCASFHTDSYPELHEEFIESGDVIWKYIPVTIGGFPNNGIATMAAGCAAEQGGFGPMRDRIFEQREAWMSSDEPESILMEEAERVGLDTEALAACMADDEGVRDALAEGDRIAQQIGVRATPTFIVQGQPVEGAPPLEAFQQALREMVAQEREPGG